MPEAVDTEFYNPAVAPMVYPQIPDFDSDGAFKFLSVFKWEERKGWKFLLEAFLSEFTRADRAVLWILTNAYHTDNDFQAKIDEFVSHTLNLTADRIQLLAPVRLLPDGIPTSEMPSLYKGADAFVIPSRGEGWGRPHCEAMSMGLPVIATHWSGPEEFMNELNSFPLHIDGLEDMKNENFPGHNWAIPSVTHLRQLMRQIVNDPVEARKRGARARRDMETKYCPVCIARLVLKELARYPLPPKA
jgi:glycosyltransferase involved in cell wall biosynthesis